MSCVTLFPSLFLESNSNVTYKKYTRGSAAFHTAEQRGAILILDEADALMYDRSTAVGSWEQSRIAEFLQQIQEFDRQSRDDARIQTF